MENKWDAQRVDAETYAHVGTRALAVENRAVVLKKRQWHQSCGESTSPFVKLHDTNRVAKVVEWPKLRKKTWQRLEDVTRDGSDFTENKWEKYVELAKIINEKNTSN